MFTIDEDDLVTKLFWLNRITEPQFVCWWLLEWYVDCYSTIYCRE